MRGRELTLNRINEKEKGYMFGLFEGDGYKFHDKKSRHYHVEFYLNSKKDMLIIDYICKLLTKINTKANLYQDKRCNCKRVRVYSKNLFNIIRKNIKLSAQSNDFNLGYVSGIIDSEGYVNKKKSYIMIINTNKKMLENCRHFLDKIKIGSYISKRKPSKKEKLPSYRMYVSVNFKNESHLSIKTKRLQL